MSRAVDIVMDAASGVIDDPRLSGEERQHVEQLCIKGFHYFDELGWTRVQEAEFIARPKVKREIERVMSLMEDGEAMMQRQAFMARVKLGGMLPAAVSIVQRVLSGDTEITVNGRKRPLTTEQYEAALEVLDRCGVDKQFVKQVTVTGVLEVTPTVDRNALLGAETPEQRYDLTAVMQREKVREVIESIARRSARADDEIKLLETQRGETVRRKKARRKRKRRDVDSRVR